MKGTKGLKLTPRPLNQHYPRRTEASYYQVEDLSENYQYHGNTIYGVPIGEGCYWKKSWK
jgi:hypothetical protein